MVTRKKNVCAPQPCPPDQLCVPCLLATSTQWPWGMRAQVTGLSAPETWHPACLAGGLLQNTWGYPMVEHGVRYVNGDRDHVNPNLSQPAFPVRPLKGKQSWNTGPASACEHESLGQTPPWRPESQPRACLASLRAASMQYSPPQASSGVSLGHQTCWREREGRHLEGKSQEREERPREGGRGGRRREGEGRGERGEWAGLGYA